MSIIIDGTNGISDIDGTASTPAIRGTDANTGIFFPAADTVAISEGGVESARFNSSGNLQLVNSLSVGNATPTTSGIGITFPATQSASTDANTLDDYEEGTFTPSVTYAGTNTPSYIYRLARYVKIGKVVTCWVFLNWNENGSTGNITFTGFPFTSVNSGAQGIPSITSFGLTGLTTPVSLVGILTQNSTSMDLRLNDNAATVFSSTYTDNDQDVYLTVTYEVA